MYHRYLWSLGQLLPGQFLLTNFFFLYMGHCFYYFHWKRGFQKILEWINWRNFVSLHSGFVAAKFFLPSSCSLLMYWLSQAKFVKPPSFPMHSVSAFCSASFVGSKLWAKYFLKCFEPIWITPSPQRFSVCP